MEERSNFGVDSPRGFGAFVVVLVAFGALSWWLHLRPELEADPSTIEGIPIAIGEWTGREIPLTEGVENMLRADSQVQRSYQTDSGDLIWLYVGYYGTARGGRPEHTPWVCYPSAGWRIVSSDRLVLSHEEGEVPGAFMNELVVAQRGQRRLVHFWYSTHRSSAIASEIHLTLDHLAGRVSSSGRADGALVRLSTPIDHRGIEHARARLRLFKGPLLDEIKLNWPASSPSA